MSFINPITKTIIININNSNRKIENAFDYLFDIWLFWESDNGSFRKEENLNKLYKSLILNTSLKDFSQYEYDYCGTQKGLKLTQFDFIESFIIDLEKMDLSKEIPVYRTKFKTFLDYLHLRKDKKIRDSKSKKNLEKILNSESFKTFEKEGLKYLEGWQYSEPASMDFEDRFELDKEAFIKTFIESDYQSEEKYNEKKLIERLIKNLKKANHPTWLNYVDFLKHKLDSINITHYLSTSKYMNQKYNNMFTVSNIKKQFKLKNGAIEKRMTHSSTFDLENNNIYDKETGELIEKGSQLSYNSSFLILFFYLNILNVKDFLTHQLKGSQNPSELLNFIKYGVLHSKRIKHEGMKEAIKDWLNEQSEPKKQKTRATEENNKTKKIIIQHYEIIDRNQGWSFAFSVEEDYKTFIQLLTDFFELKSYNLPNKILKLKPNKKSIIAKMLRGIHEELTNENTLINDHKFYEVIKKLNRFKDATNNEIYKALTK